MFLNLGSGSARFKDTINLDIAINKFTDADVQADCRILPFRDESFDGIIARHLLEHIDREQHPDTISEWRRVIKKNGTLFIEVPDFEKCIKYFLDNVQGKRDWWYKTIFGAVRFEEDRHLAGITRMYLTDLLFDNGFGKLKWVDNQIQSQRNQPILAVLATKVDFLPERLQWQL